jgi:hypothetical protein
MACLGLSRLPEVLAAAQQIEGQEVHKFDVKRNLELSPKERTQVENSVFFGFIKNVRAEAGDQELIRLLKIHSAALGRQIAGRKVQESLDNSFQSFTANFRPPRYANTLTFEIVEDTGKVFELRVTECIWASVHKEAGLDGEIGHAAFCNMDYHWPPAFNPNFRMERTKTLMQGEDCCDHRYIDTT